MRFRSILTLTLVLAGGGGLVVALLFALQLPRVSPAPTPTVTLVPDAVASVNGDSISRAEWQKAVAIDRAMSQLAGQAAPSAEVTLDRLINQRLVWRAAANKITAGDAAAGEAADAKAQERLTLLEQNWRADDAAVDRALASVGLSRQDLMTEIKRLLVVEAYLKQVQDPTAWLAAQRAQARVGVLTELASSQPVTPEPGAQTAAPTPLVPVPTSTPAKNVPLGSAPGQAAFDFSLDDVSGQRVKLSDLRGHPVVVNFWATWCPPCRQELPALQAAYQRYRDQGVVLLGVDVRESAETVRGFAPQFGLTFPLLLDGDGAVSDRYQVRGIPTTVFLDAESVVRARHVGPLTEDKFAEYVSPLLSISKSLETSEVSRALDFSLPRENGQTIRLSDYRDKSSVVLVFYRGQT